MKDWRDRIIEVKRMKVRDIAGHPQNPKDHPARQRAALTASLNEIGKADVLRAYYSAKNDNRLTLWDGHHRQGLDLDAEWWIAVTDLDDTEAALMLATFDPIAALAETNAERLAAVLADVRTGEAALQEMLAEIAAKSGLTPPIDPLDEWQGMPEFYQENKEAFQSIHVHFKTMDARNAFANLIGQTLTDQTRYLWYPQIEIERYSDKSYSDES